MRWIGDTGLAYLANNYKYSSCDQSILGKYVLQPYWNFVVTLFPRWLAPNLITFIGFTLNILSYFVLSYYAPTMREDAPNWTFLLAAFTLFAYQTLDAIDGKQARRTGSSSPLGELFDHGCDALSTHLIVMTQMCVFQERNLWAQLFVVATTSIAFYLAAWEQYCCGALTFPPISGPVEGIVSSVLLFVAVGLCGQGLLQPTVFTFYGIEWTYARLFMAAVYITCVGTLVVNFYNALVQPAKAADKKLPFVKCLSVLLPIIYPIGVFAHFLNWRPDLIVEIRTLCCIFAMSVANMVSRLIVCRMCGLKYNFLTILPQALPVTFLAALPFVMPDMPTADIQTVLRIVLLWTVAAYMFLAVTVTKELCRFLNIKCFTIKPKAAA